MSNELEAIARTAERLREHLAVDEDRVWSVPREIRIDLPTAPKFDAAALLPHSLAQFVLDEADRMPCPPDYIAAALMVALGSVIGSSCALKPKRRDDWIVTPNLFGGVVGDPSSKKTPAVNQVMRFLDRLERHEEEANAQALKVFEVEKAAFSAHQRAVQTMLTKAASSGTGMSAAMAAMQALEEPVEPKPRRFKSNDSTVPKLGDLLASNPAGLLLFRDELIGLLASWEQEGNEGDRSFYLEAWNGTSSFNIDRIGRGSISVPTLCMSVFGGIQPDLLQRYLAQMADSLDNDGRIQRFQVLVFPEAAAWEWRDQLPMRGAREAVRDLFDRLSHFDPVQDGAHAADDFVKVPYFAFDDEAQEVFIEWSKELQRERIPQEQDPLLRQHLAKFEKLFCALALILHLSEEIGPVTAKAAIRAAAWTEYLLGHAKKVYALADAARVANAHAISRRLIQRALPDGFTVRDVSRKGWRGLEGRLNIEQALGVLEQFGWILGVDTEDGISGRPTRKHFINPRIQGNSE